MSLDRLDELVDHWTLLEDERLLVGNKSGATGLGFALLLKFYTLYGRFPRGRSELAEDAIEFIATQVKVEPSEIALYEWEGRTNRFQVADPVPLGLPRVHRPGHGEVH
ncbi:DUF4158 domain-containing protein [Glycomyces buryatensis]|uniref:DUF4158 domain-containing protein n=1 Tax=Glycomyces buryatensis TaxID=2570927 RepID=A0A4S8QFA9_9ACTN|nr:DUF4158 domain-containing protein [Glycomyces buryatensis]THV43098.1 DUF4158 domain-containing protein [Glycomyces buryatensis]